MSPLRIQQTPEEGRILELELALKALLEAVREIWTAEGGDAERLAHEERRSTNVLRRERKLVRRRDV